MIKYKTEAEIKIMTEGGKKLRRIAEELQKFSRPAVTTEAIDHLAEKLIQDEGGESSFKKVPGYFWNTCLPINEQIVHTPPSTRALKKGDLLTIDIGMLYRGFHTDFAITFVVGNSKNPGIDQFLKTGDVALSCAMSQVKNGNYLGNVSKVIQETIEGRGYCIIKELTGHGIGRNLHEDPVILGFLNKDPEKTLKIKAGLVLAIEVIYAMNTGAMVYEKNSKWSIVTKNKSLAACFEKTVAVSAKKAVVLT